jgi:putative selenate reductase
MSDRMIPAPFDQLMDELLRGYEREGRVLGVYDLYRHNGGQLPLFGEKIETPFGPAAGPHTQLAGNIISAYAAGARYFELKTVQTLDGEDLPVSKPCNPGGGRGLQRGVVHGADRAPGAGRVREGLVRVKLISKAWGLGDPEGFAFNMSVGYDLAGIQSEKIDRFIEGLKDASGLEEFRPAAPGRLKTSAGWG